MKLIIKSIDESFVYLDTEPSLLRELVNRFKFRVENFMYSPLYKAGKWDGYIKLINAKLKTSPKGLVPDIINYCKENNYNVSLDESFKKFSITYTFDYTKYNLPFEPYDYQIAAVQRAIDKKRQIILSPTGSGKSLILYLMMREFLKVIDEQKILIIVPTIGLVTQIFNDFKDYAVQDTSFIVEDNCHMIYEGISKETEKRVIISTYQSIYKEPSKREDEYKISKRGNLYLEDFGAVICDECHTAKSDSIKSLLEKSINAFFKIGLTGTLDGALTNEMTLKGLFGSIHRVATTTDLIDRNILAKLKINFINIKYDEPTCILLRHADYRMELDWLVSNVKRNVFISKMATGLKGNVLILVQYIEKHGKLLFEMLKELAAKENKKVYFVYGKTEAEEREAVRKLAEENSNIIILASYQVFSAGVNIKNLPNIIFGSPTKGKIRLLQSIGRGIRLHEDKEFCRIIDISDDLRYAKRKKENYVLEHAKSRLIIYQNEGFDVIEKNINLTAS